MEKKHLSRFEYRGRAVQFSIDEPADEIQRTQLNGHFYELEILERLRNIIPRDSVILDVGANVGNHTVFFGLFCQPRQVIPFEPNTHIASILRQNVELNSLKSVDFSCISFGISGADFQAFLQVKSRSNWGNGHLTGEAAIDSSAVFAQRVDVRRLDSFDFPQVDFIKADVEGHELELLKGARHTLITRRPSIFIEVGEERSGAVFDFLLPIGYQMIDYFSMYRGQRNYLFVPIK